MKRQSDDQALTTLMQAAQAGDAQAYVRLLKEITPRLRQIVRRQRFFVSAEDIEDLVQDILLSLHAVRASYDPRRPPPAPSAGDQARSRSRGCRTADKPAQVRGQHNPPPARSGAQAHSQA